MISTPGVVASNRIIRRNTVLNAIDTFAGAESNDWEANGKAPAIYLDDHTNHVEVAGNVIAHGAWTGILINGGSDNRITGNLVFDFPLHPLADRVPRRFRPG